jgi:hypothetical protein
MSEVAISSKILQYFAFAMAMIAFSYAWHQKGILFIVPEGIYIGAFSAISFFSMYRSFRAIAWDYVAAGQIFLILPIIIGLLAFSRLTKFRWLARFPVAVMSGVGVGALFGLTLRGQFLAIIGDTVKDVMKPTNDPVSKLLFVVLLIPVMLLFLYSRKFSNIVYNKGGLLYYAQRIGRIGLLIVVGYQTSIAVEVRLIQSIIKPVVDDIVRAIGLWMVGLIV